MSDNARVGGKSNDGKNSVRRRKYLRMKKKLTFKVPFNLKYLNKFFQINKHFKGKFLLLSNLTLSFPLNSNISFYMFSDTGINVVKHF